MESDTFELLHRLSGRWRGHGRGNYPTIDPFEFSEETTFLVAPSYPLIRYEQRAWLEPDHEPSHWELGIWRVVEGGDVELSTAQDSGRVEVLRGRPKENANGDLELELVSKCLANDPRLVRTERSFVLRGGVLHTRQFMATTTTPSSERLQHLEATLERIGDA